MKRHAYILITGLIALGGALLGTAVAAEPDDELVAARRLARSTVQIGGEFNTDYTFSLRDRDGGASGTVGRGDWALQQTNLRFYLDLGNGAQGRIKLDLSERSPREQAILEEALLIWRQICGGPFGIIFGKGEIPYGQDRTLGVIQSYHHNNGADSSEGVSIFNRGAPIWHPGEIDRVVMGGVSFDWRDILRLEVAVFQPDDYAERPRDWQRGGSGFESLAARLWWQTPLEGLVAELSGVRQYISDRQGQRVPGNRDAARNDEYAFSVGLDYRAPTLPLELFAEYEMGINWNFTTGYNTHTVSAGGLYQLTDKIELGAMAEWLRIDNRGAVADYNKFVAHGKYTWASGLYFIGEYGVEALNWGQVAHVFALRTGVAF
ncbi:hypothetical protein FACS1894139_07510 [Planctomycetales bacterium]|nr:hypothetical protein FACS1894107_16040 [Planctomycetales bacterium]GHT04782.1 hypothetical protein FACS1894139_07510 [Planctomycetales bacterium]